MLLCAAGRAPKTPTVTFFDVPTFNGGADKPTTFKVGVNITYYGAYAGVSSYKDLSFSTAPSKGVTDVNVTGSGASTTRVLEFALTHSKASGEKVCSI